MELWTGIAEWNSGMVKINSKTASNGIFLSQGIPAMAS